MINSMIKLAQEGTDAAWRTLFIKLCDFVVSDIDQRTSQELAIFSEVALKLYGLASDNDRARLAQNIAQSSKTPNSLAKKLARDSQ